MTVDPFVFFREGMVAEPAQGLTMILGRARAGDEVATALGVSATTIEQDWRLARAWLAGRHGGGDE
jgi:hypothetical protein